MDTAFVIVTLVTVLANAAIAVADLRGAAFVRANSAEVGVPRDWLWWLGALKGAGAAGLLLGLLGVPWVGEAAAVGLVLFFTGAVIAHVRAGVYRNMAFPGGFLCLAAAVLVLGAAAR
ncbi:MULTISPECIES: DoxX family protein [Streptomyces]|uniref:DoxX family protein n=1 Tax=Streptomyces lichenis TaxID=2306967 RepID=A0ABT0I6F1_9ACTN|nr:DoxX family protein [Streptomyces lichenis]MCK8676898.1 DoxX family protein [Streptomyces lichenis]